MMKYPHLFCAVCSTLLATASMAAQAADSTAHRTAETRKPAPAFNVTSIDGGHFSLKALRGRVVVLNFWFIGCPPCRQEMPGLNRLVDVYAGMGVVFLGMALDTRSQLAQFLQKTSFHYTIIPSASGEATAYKVAGYPTHVVIDRRGGIVASLMGGGELAEFQLRPLIERALGR